MLRDVAESLPVDQDSTRTDDDCRPGIMAIGQYLERDRWTDRSSRAVAESHRPCLRGCSVRAHAASSSVSGILIPSCLPMASRRRGKEADFSSHQDRQAKDQDGADDETMLCTSQLPRAPHEHGLGSAAWSRVRTSPTTARLWQRTGVGKVEGKKTRRLVLRRLTRAQGPCWPAHSLQGWTAMAHGVRQAYSWSALLRRGGGMVFWSRFRASSLSTVQ